MAVGVTGGLILIERKGKRWYAVFLNDTTLTLKRLCRETHPTQEEALTCGLRSYEASRYRPSP